MQSNVNQQLRKLITKPNQKGLKYFPQSRSTLNLDVEPPKSSNGDNVIESKV